MTISIIRVDAVDETAWNQITKTISQNRSENQKIGLLIHG